MAFADVRLGKYRKGLLWLRRDGKRVTRALLVIEALWWGIDLLMPWPTFPISHIYDLMASWAPEWAWGIVFLASGLLGLQGFMGRRLLRIGSAGFDGLTHAFVVTSCIVSAPGGTGTGTQTIWLLASYLLVEWETMDA